MKVGAEGVYEQMSRWEREREREREREKEWKRLNT
jgi:hypothetical protein